jgi:hypothetical protein
VESQAELKELFAFSEKTFICHNRRRNMGSKGALGWFGDLGFTAEIK